MTPTEIAAQLIGIVAMAFNILSYQGKKQSTVILMQFFGAVFFTVNFLMLGAVVGGVLNLIAAVRALIFLNKEKLKADHIGWFVGFIVVYIAVYILNFTAFGKEPTAYHLVIELLPVIGMIAVNIGFRLKTAADVRKCGLVGSPAWLIYNIATGSWGAIICEVISLLSIFVGIFRHDRKKEV
ncbi:MAG: YgjV family protein [Oscillospiraceae bacterium]|nr:YgjV family protein [Oscillospiraceae bacterium]